MTHQVGTKNSHPIIEDSDAPGVPVTDYGDQLGYLTANNSAWIANNKVLLGAIAAVTPSDGGFLVGNGSSIVVESGATARTSLGLGELATQDQVAISDITATGTPGASTFLRGDGAWTTIPGGGDMLSANNLSDVANASTARINLGVAIGSDVQAYDADLTALAGLAKTDGSFIVGDGNTWTIESGATARASLGLTIGTHVQAYDDNLAAIVAQRTDGTIISRPSMTTYSPASNTDDARGTALATALAAFVASSDTVLELSEDHTYEVGTALSATFTRGVEITNGTIKADAASDLNWVLKVANNSTGVVTLRGITVDHNNCTRTSGVGDTLFTTGTGQVDVVDCIVKNGPHDSNTNDATPSADGSLLRLEGTGVKRAIRTRLIDAGYSTWRSHAQITEFEDVWSICHTRKAGAYQRHGYCDSEAMGVNMLKLQLDRYHVVDTAAHKVNMNLDPSSNGPEWLEELYFNDCTWDISTSHTNPDTDYFLKINYVRRVHMKNCVERHSNIDTIVSTVYTEQRNTTSLEGFLNIGLCEMFTIENCRFDGSIKGIGSGTVQCDDLIVRNSCVGENADIYEALINVSNFGRVLWDSNQIKNCVGRTAGSRCVFDMTDCTTTGSIFLLAGKNYIHTNFPAASGQAGALIRNCPLTVGQVGIDDYVHEKTTGSLDLIPAFTEEQRLAATAYASDPKALCLSRNIAKGGALRAIGSGSGVYATTQQQPAGAANFFPDLTGVPGAIIYNFDPSNGAAACYFWTGSLWDTSLV